MKHQVLACQGQIVYVLKAKTHPPKAHQKKTPGHLERLFHVLRTHALSRHKEPEFWSVVLMVHQKKSKQGVVFRYLSCY